MFLTNLNTEIVACILLLLFRKSRHKPNLESTSKYGFSRDLGRKYGGVLTMRMQVILDSPFAHPGSAPIGDGEKGEFRDWTKQNLTLFVCMTSHAVKKRLYSLAEKENWYCLVQGLFIQRCRTLKQKLVLPNVVMLGTI